MSYWIWSAEGFPHTGLIGKVGYTPEYVQWDCITVIVPKQEWFKLAPVSRYRIHEHWRDIAGRERIVSDREIVGHFERHFGKTSEDNGLVLLRRGMAIADREPSTVEKEALEKLSREANFEYRRRQVQLFEQAFNDKDHPRHVPTPYEDECYDVLGFPKPYSLDTMRDQRRPGEASADRIATAITNALAGLGRVAPEDVAVAS